MPSSFTATYPNKKIMTYLKNKGIFCISDFRNEFSTKFQSRKHIFHYENINFIFWGIWQSNGGRSLNLVIDASVVIRGSVGLLALYFGKITMKKTNSLS